MTDKILRRAAVEEMTGLSRSTLYRMMDRGEFPRPARIGQRAVGWRQSAIENWLVSLSPLAEQGRRNGDMWRGAA
ncbi:AlpA family phage regulatory protein [Limimaricola variabilis]|uniref:helix-turn-helix transcriptional regulator n=1 Tax=Limimaricola variabilis TaxID=1492771 RepID=UPI002AC94ABD|nr:AlpA family phage regulatory protein [Limimaricola variabilis]WPY94222.1 AlpA family phage regulatory protein [Limimaricola variabilis]